MSQKTTHPQSKSIFAEANYLEPLSDPPGSKPIGREKEIRLIGEVASGKWKRNLVVCGPPGCGKTLCVKYALKHATGEGVKSVYVNAGKTRTPYYTLCEILREFGVDVPFSGWQMARLKQEFEWATRELQAVVAIDEAEVVLDSADESIAFWFTRQSNVNLILIMNSIGAVKMLPQKVRSTLSPFPIGFAHYSKELAKEILKQRLDKALVKDALEEKWVDAMAELASKRGDLRTAYQMVLTAAKIAEANGRDKIEREDFDLAAEAFDGFDR